MFFPGETIAYRFVIPFSANEIDNVIVSYKQNDHITLEKTITSGFVSEANQIASFSYQLSQAEALTFEDNLPYTIQLNVYTIGGTRHTSHELKGSSGIQYVREVMQHA